MSNKKDFTATGQAVFREINDNVLLYTETGYFHDRDNVLISEFFRSYRYEFHADSIDIIFADGLSIKQLFQKLYVVDDEIMLQSDEAHLCGDDRYNGFYVIETENRFSIQYDVIGPRKNYQMNTQYIRLPSDTTSVSRDLNCK